MNSNNSSIYEQVRKIVRKFDTNDPFKIAKESNIKIKYLDNATDLLGMYTVIQRNRFIFLNSNMEEYMMKMVLAHELGHDALHRHLTKIVLFMNMNCSILLPNLNMKLISLQLIFYWMMMK